MFKNMPLTMFSRGVLRVLALVVLLTAQSVLVLWAEDYRVEIETGVRVPMQDGVKLVADVYRPQAEGKFPVVLQRTPYNRSGEASMARYLAGKGYIVVLQDTRGRFDSEGEFYPFRYESRDGYDTVEWSAALEGSDGRVGMYGGSYVGATQMLAAISTPPHLEAIFPYVTASEYYDGWTYQSGAWMQWFSSSWTSGLSLDTLRRHTGAATRARDWVIQLPVDHYSLLSLPSPGELAPYFRDWIEHETDDEYWGPWKISDYYQKLKIKALHAGGWHDIFVNGSIGNYIGMRQTSATPEARAGQRLLIGPWAHAATSPEGKIGDVVFGKPAVLDMQETALQWFDYALKGVKNQYATGAPVRLFVMGDNIWRDEQEFPLAREKKVKYFLHSSKGARGMGGDGTLDVNLPSSENPEVFEYDPANPVPTIGGRLCCGAELPPGPADQRANETRGDVLVFSTPVLEKDLEVTGYLRMELYASSSAVDTDFTALLSDVDPSGYSRYLADGIVRARYRNSTRKAEPIVPGNVYRYNIDLWVTSNLFKTGHRLRLYLSSSNFPRFNRNLNTGEPTLGGSRMVKATQTIFHDSAHPSALILPVIPGGAGN